MTLEPDLDKPYLWLAGILLTAGLAVAVAVTGHRRRGGGRG